MQLRLPLANTVKYKFVLPPVCLSHQDLERSMESLRDVLQLGSGAVKEQTRSTVREVPESPAGETLGRYDEAARWASSGLTTFA